MKKLIMALLIMMLLVGGLRLDEASANEANEENLHLLWEIPFHISPQECLQLLEEKTGAKMQIDENFQSVVTLPDSQVTLFG